MKIARFLLKLFVIFSLPFGIVAALLLALIGGLTGEVMGYGNGAVTGALAGLFGGCFAGMAFGGLMTLLLGGVHLTQTRNTQVQHSASFKFSGNGADARQLCQDAVSQVPGTAFDPDLSSDTVLVATKERTWKSWGDRISFTISTPETGQQLITVESRPVMKATMLDYGSNEENVAIITRYLVEKRGLTQVSL